MDILHVKGLGSIAIKNASCSISPEELAGLIRRKNRNGIVVQAFDKGRIICSVHLAGAYADALASFKSGTNKSERIEIEMLMFAAFTDRITQAISNVGVKSCSGFVLFSNGKLGLEKLGLDGIMIGRDFNPSLVEIKKRAKLAGIDVRGKGRRGIDVEVLQRMALSRLSQ
ncbi:MAG: KEOPS complex subunit Cgi121 [Candidatus Micrarchaeaceae archaeon]